MRLAADALDAAVVAQPQLLLPARFDPLHQVEMRRRLLQGASSRQPAQLGDDRRRTFRIARINRSRKGPDDGLTVCRLDRAISAYASFVGVRSF
jgi:hypothetical protein